MTNATPLSRRALLASTTAVAMGVAASRLTSCSSPTTAGNGSEATPSAARALTFPRTGTCFLDQRNLPSVDDFARYDLVIIDAEWHGRLAGRFFTELRAANPRMTLLPYVNFIDSMSETGSVEYWANAHSLWQFADPSTSEFPREWLAYTADGEPVHEWEDRIMTNLTDVAPPVGGEIYAEYAANWAVDHVWSTGVWDGIFLDVWGDRIYGADHDHWDIDGDGVDEPDTEIYGPGRPLDRGLAIAENIMRTRMPDALLVANGDREAHGQTLDGLAFEGFADIRVDPERDELFEITRYVTRSSGPGVRQPGMEVTINRYHGVTPGSADDHRRARFFLTATLLQNAYWTPMGVDYADLVYYDEMDGGGIGRGYLGHAVIDNPDMDLLSTPSTDGTGSPADGVFRRDFEHGIALVNTTDEPRDIVLEHTYRRLSGTQDPLTNNGEHVAELTLPPKDGLILLRKG